MAIIETRGRKPIPEHLKKPPQATVKINNIILPFVIQLKSNLKKGNVTPDILQSLFNVLNGNSLTIEEGIRLKLVQKYDDEHRKVISLQSKNLSLQSTVKTLKTQIKQFQNKEHDCQALTKSGKRCTKPAKLKTNWHGVEINVCIQHSKKVN